MLPEVEPAFTRVIAAAGVHGLDVKTVNRAVDLASRLDLEVAGLFIEDINLFRAAGLPMVRHLAIGSGVLSPLSMGQLEEDMRQVAARAAAVLGAAAARRSVKCSFRVVRGFAPAELNAATMAKDLLVVAGRRERGLPLRLDSSLEHAVRHASCSILFAGLQAKLSRPLAVVRAGASSTLRILTSVTRFTAVGAADVAVLVAGAPAGTAEAGTPIGSALSAAGYRSHVEETGAISLSQLIRAVRSGDHDLLVLPADLALPENLLESLMKEVSCDILVVQ